VSGPAAPPPLTPSSPPPVGRASSFRRAQGQRRSGRREMVGVLVVVALLALGVYTVVATRPFSPGPDYELPAPGAPIVVHFGTPTVRSVACSAGGTAYAEEVPWMNSTAPVTTGDLLVRVVEIADGDFIGDPHAVANATTTNLCAGTPPTSETVWYAVLSAPNGTNLVTYTTSDGWTSVGSGPWAVGIENGSALTLVTYTSLAGTGRGLSVYGAAGGSLIVGSVPL
jgi:hypothetical protein